MRVSRLMLVTLRDVPADAEIISHQLLVRAGFIKRVTSGVYAYMPLMWRVLKKIISVVREELDAKDCLESLLPQLHPAEIWKQSGRWQGYTAGEGIMFHLQDRQGREVALGPTHEEVITKIVGETLNSYKQLPINLYQIQTKFRDEIRPRFGLMRSREFIMKDAYSFHSSAKGLKETYLDMNNAYERIFKRCGLHTVSVDADSGSIGDAESREFMVTADSGEDLILFTKDKKYAANQEKAESLPSEAKVLKESNLSLIETIDQKTVDEICSNNDFEPSQIVKVILLLASLDNNVYQPIIVSIRGDQYLNEVKLINALSKKLKANILSLKTISKEQLENQNLAEIPFGYIGPDLDDSFLTKSNIWEQNFIRFADNTAANLEYFVCGANKINYHRVCASWSSIGGKPEIVDIRKALPGDSSVHNPNEKLIARRGIEVGHIFQLGRKYSSSLNATFTNANGNSEPFWMGCYGIGISRLAQASIEQSHDEAGIIWPLSIAPFEVIVIVANIKDSIQQKLAEEIYGALIEEGVDALLDDRAERAGVKFKDADLIGIPWKIVAGRDSESNKVEITNRSNGDAKVLTSQKAIRLIIEEISTYKKSLSFHSL